jgi:hypothetical protein
MIQTTIMTYIKLKTLTRIVTVTVHPDYCKAQNTKLKRQSNAGLFKLAGTS